MDPGPVDRQLRSNQAGFATVQHVAAAALAMVFFVFLANLIVMQYTMAAVTGALDEGVRLAARSAGDHPEVCLERIDAAVGSMLAAPISSSLQVSCWIEGSVVRAEAIGLLRGWLPAVPDVPFRREAFSPLEPAAS